LPTEGEPAPTPLWEECQFSVPNDCAAIRRVAASGTEVRTVGAGAGAAGSSQKLGDRIVQISSEASQRPIMMAFTIESARRNSARAHHVPLTSYLALRQMSSQWMRRKRNGDAQQSVRDEVRSAP